MRLRTGTTSDSRRKDRLDRVTRQLSEFYGPLLALTYASTASWVAFRRRYRPTVRGYWDDPVPTAEEAAVWRLWITVVFTPLNRQMRDVVVTKADLIEETEMPQVLLDLCAHVAAYEPVLKRWEDGDYSEHIGVFNFPGEELRAYLSPVFRALKAEQTELLRREVRKNRPDRHCAIMTDPPNGRISDRDAAGLGVASGGRMTTR